ncbi:unnamed protein product [Caenorhabditis sp. 36 PRJEB53466]|nr:unnamed protein product [Caenorhabditis sp. 36 PRJEB53466]
MRRILLLLLFPSVHGSFKMVVINGEPASYSDYSTVSESWTSCVSYCYYSSTCVTVYSPDTSGTCRVFRIDQISSVTQLYDTTGQTIAIKMVSNSTDGSCSSSSSGNSMTGYVTTNSTYQSYNITVSDATWTFSTDTQLSCLSDFQLFVRPLGPWCIGVITTGCISQTDSVSQCSSTYGGILSGLQTVEEYDYILSIGQPYLEAQSTYTRYGYWVNGFRNSSCVYPTARTAACNGTNEFYFTDPLLSAYDGYIWASGQPDGITSKQLQNCLSVDFSSAEGIDDYKCNATTVTSSNYTLCYAGYACGLEPA